MKSVRRLVATDSSFDALCHEYVEVMELLHGFEVQVKRLSRLGALWFGTLKEDG